MKEQGVARAIEEPSSHALEVLFELGRRARKAADTTELGFILVNDTLGLCHYRQAVLWLREGGIQALSGVVQPEANAPYVQWLDRIFAKIDDAGSDAPKTLTACDIDGETDAEWEEWLPTHALWLPFPATSENEKVTGGLLLAREQAWENAEIVLLGEWSEMWLHAWRARHVPPRWQMRRTLANLRTALKNNPDAPLWKQPRVRWATLAFIACILPIRLSVLAPAELVPASPAVIRAPIDGVVGSFQVRPNDAVKTGQALLSFDEAALTSRIEVAQQALATAEAEYRQAAQLAVNDIRQKAQLALLTGKIEERRAEAAFLEGQLERSRITAPQDGIVLFDDPSEWIGKPVVTGERIMRVATPDDIEVEAWLNVGDAIPVANESPVSLYLSAAPLSSVNARVRYIAHDAVQRPDGQYAYRVRARIDGRSEHRVGLKGTAKLHGGRVPLIYWVLRRPLATIRQTIGW